MNSQIGTSSLWIFARTLSALLLAGCEMDLQSSNFSASDAGPSAMDDTLNTRQQALEQRADGGSSDESSRGGGIATTVYSGQPVGVAESCQQDEPAHAAREESARLARERQVYERQELARDFFYRIPDDVEGVVGVMLFVATPDDTMTLEEANSRRVAATPPADARERDAARRQFARDCPDEVAESEECMQHPYMLQLAEREAARIGEYLRPDGLQRGLTLEQAGVNVRPEAWLVADNSAEDER
jgi:hypothetical protein